MKVVIDPNSGFCFGVVYAIQAAENELEKKGTLYCLGDIVHNNMEVERLKSKGLKIISHEEFSQLTNAVVLIRAHGEPPETYRIALENNIQLIDASCPVVLRLQNKIRLGFDEALKKNAQIVIYGKEGHAEVNGLVGQTDNSAIIINDLSDIDKIDFSKSVILFSQTTQSKDGFDEVVSTLKNKLKDKSLFVEANDTICRQVSNREPQISLFAREHDVIIFVGGKKSSNGIFLYNVCLKNNNRSYFISSPEELNPVWFSKCRSAGVCGATSTPRWLMEQVADVISKLH
ncbi:MAG: 4-hydroxy-3-methylbut-2-enyl diphosphate reductase [Bacteroidetes bacterium ADurb.Bin408]|nr:MAG: 4-hydroxy-3-methylbut-2-enyl diphosphate reductase [Bacteroidetes bacterium ADurb.Bin408]